MATHDGNGWVVCRCGERHWGRHGAAGLLLARESGSSASVEVLLQLRAAWTHQGGSWALPGGARDSHEDAVSAALREALEEAGVSADALAVLGQRTGVEHVDWNYIYVLAVAQEGLNVTAGTTESDELRWVSVDGVADLALHPAFAEAWPELREALDDARAGGQTTPA